MLTAGNVSPDKTCLICRGPYGGQDPMLGNPPFSGSLANALADSLGLPGLSAAPPSQTLPTGLPGSNGGLPFNMGLPNGGARHHIDSLSAVSHCPQDCLAAVSVYTEHIPRNALLLLHLPSPAAQESHSTCFVPCYRYCWRREASSQVGC